MNEYKIKKEDEGIRLDKIISELEKDIYGNKISDGQFKVNDKYEMTSVFKNEIKQYHFEDIDILLFGEEEVKTARDNLKDSLDSLKTTVSNYGTTEIIYDSFNKSNNYIKVIVDIVKDYLDALYENLIKAEAKWLELKMARINKVYAFLIKEINLIYSRY